MLNKTLAINISILNDFVKRIESNDMVISCPISLEKNLYNGDYFNLFIKEINNYKNKISRNKRVKKIQLDVGDTLNRHIWYYRYCKNFMLQHNLKKEVEIPEKIRMNLKNKSYLASVKQGMEWFKNNINAINQLIPKKFRLKEDFKLGNKITILYEGDDENPRIEYICYDYWLKHPKYKNVEKALREVCDLEDSIIERAYNNAVNYYEERFIKRGEDIKFDNFFKKQSYNYLFDEGVASCILHKESKNTIEFYFGGRETNGTQVFRGKKAQNDPVIKEYLKGVLKGADQRKFVSVKVVEE